MAEALTHWGQLKPPQGDVPEKHRNLVLLGKDGVPVPVNLPSVVPLLPQFLEALRALIL
jgi:hypothetical protein